VLCKETHSSVIRLAPPLMIDKADLEWGLEHIRSVLEEKSEARREPKSELAEAATSARA
jgi:ornithine--oxo-acid transaminase